MANLNKFELIREIDVMNTYAQMLQRDLDDIKNGNLSVGNIDGAIYNVRSLHECLIRIRLLNSLSQNE
jgi:hypothetical protein